MTALNAIIGSTTAFVLTDSLLYRPTGEIFGFGRKAEIAQEAQIVVGTRGDHRLALAIAEAIDEAYPGIDDLVQDEAGELSWRYEQTLAQYGTELSAAQIVMVGWSEAKDRPIGVTLFFDGQIWDFAEILDGVASPLPGPTELSQLRFLRAAPGDDWSPDDFDPTAHGIPFLEAQRRMKLEIVPGGPRGHAVGGEILLTMLRKDGITQEIIHAWPDEAGVPIKPEPFARPIVVGMSRQQRRAAERQARRA